MWDLASTPVQALIYGRPFYITIEALKAYHTMRLSSHWVIIN
jgi:hypothetical protein